MQNRKFPGQTIQLELNLQFKTDQKLWKMKIPKLNEQSTMSTIFVLDPSNNRYMLCIYNLPVPCASLAIS